MGDRYCNLSIGGDCALPVLRKDRWVEGQNDIGPLIKNGPTYLSLICAHTEKTVVEIKVVALSLPPLKYNCAHSDIVDSPSSLALK